MPHTVSRAGGHIDDEFDARNIRGRIESVRIRRIFETLTAVFRNIACSLEFSDEPCHRDGGEARVEMEIKIKESASEAVQQNGAYDWVNMIECINGCWV